MRIIGITGGIGCGKSEVLRYLESLGAYVVEADKLAHRLMKKGSKTYNEIIEYFGTDILGPEGEIDRPLFGKIVFGDEKALKKLDLIVHPAVKEYILKDIRLKKNEGKCGYYVIEAALLIEDGYKEICDEIWYIYADENTRLNRLVNGRGGNISAYKKVMEKQADEAYYRTNSDVIIDNNGDFENTRNELKVLLNKTN
ncbi:MAG: dephospho-CoA kinase [Lachnospiraceae bacterium]|nr:dephospho-CoA kinase [Lachnospiraceae bacterium]